MYERYNSLNGVRCYYSENKLIPFSIHTIRKNTSKVLFWLLPYFLYRLIYHRKSNKAIISFKGNYKNIADAQKESTGYDEPNILEKTKQALLKVKNNEAVFEKDSILHKHIKPNWPLLSSLLYVSSNNQLSIIDFGGSLGSTFYLIRNWAPFIKINKWVIIEQDHYVKVGSELFADEILSFETDLKEAIDKYKTNAILLSSVLAYLTECDQILKIINESSIRYILFDRTLTTDATHKRYMVQTIPESIYKASYSCVALPFNHIETTLTNYKTIFSFNSAYDPEYYTLEDGTKLHWKGWLFERIRK